MAKKLLYEGVPVGLSFCKKKNPGRKSIDAMHDKRALSLRIQFCGKQSQGGRCVSAFDRHGRKSGRFIDGHHSIVFVEQEKLP